MRLLSRMRQHMPLQDTGILEPHTAHLARMQTLLKPLYGRGHYLPRLGMDLGRLHHRRGLPHVVYHVY
jgi:hypothetical protein